MECDGSCFRDSRTLEEIPCEDGEVLCFYFCFHEQEWILTTYAPPKEAEHTPRS